jgi:hypothetical protein
MSFHLVFNLVDVQTGEAGQGYDDAVDDNIPINVPSQWGGTGGSHII